jgi:hypothetical protein
MNKMCHSLKEFYKTTIKNSLLNLTAKISSKFRALRGLYLKRRVEELQKVVIA